MSKKLFFTFASSGLAKGVSVAIIVFLSSTMSADEFGRFSYGYSYILSLATFVSYVIGHTWSRLVNQDVGANGVLPALAIIILCSSLLSSWVASVADLPLYASVIFIVASSLCVLSYCGQFISIFYGESLRLFRWISISAVVLCAAMFLSYHYEYKVSITDVFWCLVIVYLFQCFPWRAIFSRYSKDRLGVWSGALPKSLAKFSLISMMGAPVHFICISFLGRSSGLVEVGIFNVSFQIFISFIFFVSSAQPYLVRYFRLSPLNTVFRLLAYMTIGWMAYTCLFFSFYSYFSCDEISLSCLSDGLVWMCLLAAFVAAANLIIQQYINANLHLEYNMALQTGYASVYVLSAFYILSQPVGAEGLYAAILMASTLLLAAQFIVLLVGGKSEDCRN